VRAWQLYEGWSLRGGVCLTGLILSIWRAVWCIKSALRSRGSSTRAGPRRTGRSRRTAPRRRPTSRPSCVRLRPAGRSAWGSVASSLCTTAYPLHTRFTNLIGTSASEATMRPNPRSASTRTRPPGCRGRWWRCRGRSSSSASGTAGARPPLCRGQPGRVGTKLIQPVARVHAID
jgi:hypothetical protein